MIIVNKQGRLGNNLFQYFFAKIISLEVGIEFYTIFDVPLEFGLENKKIQNLIKPDHILSEIWNGPKCNLFLDDTLIKENINDILKIIKEKNINSLFLDGYFQQIDYYLNYLSLIKNSFKYKKENKKNILGIHVRKDDINNTINDLPDEWFLSMVKMFPHHKKYVTTDSISHPLINTLIDMGCELYINSPQKTIIEFSQFSDLILSQGTFSWWMGFLSDGNKHCMIPKQGWNSKNSGVNTLLNENSWVYYDDKFNRI